MSNREVVLHKKVKLHLDTYTDENGSAKQICYIRGRTGCNNGCNDLFVEINLKMSEAIVELLQQLKIESN